MSRFVLRPNAPQMVSASAEDQKRVYVDGSVSYVNTDGSGTSQGAVIVS
jgi:formylmethanofuran dehydrogenase subunit C